MKPYIPGPAAWPRECVRETADLEVSLQHKHAPLAQLRHEARECQSADTGTYNNRVVVRLRRHAVRLSSSRNSEYRRILSVVRHKCFVLNSPRKNFQKRHCEEMGTRAVRHCNALPRTGLVDRLAVSRPKSTRPRITPSGPVRWGYRLNNFLALLRAIFTRLVETSPHLV